MKKHIRFTAFFLAMVMILSLFTGMASAEEGEAESETNLQTQTNETDNTLTLQPITAEDYESFSIRKAPDIISAAEIAENGYIGRVASQEKDLYTLVFKNSNGSYTKKIYSHPVKYVDDTGVVRDISLELGQNKDGSFSTASHEIVTTFKKNPVNGITIDYKDVSIRMVPALTGNKAPAATISSDNKKITYNLDSTTAYVYELTYAGYKEDIVVKKYTGQTEYTFKLFTNGLTLEKINETYCLTDSNGEVKATIGDVIIFTADERNNTFGSMTYETVRQNQEYIITIHVDADYLKDPNTVYPIRIDPTIEIKYANNGAGAIEDVTLNSNAGSDGSSTSLLIGKRNTYGISRVLLKVPALTFDAIPYAASITSATIAIRDIMCQSSSLDIYCHKFLGGTWTESTASWSSVNPNNYGSYLDMYTVSYSNGVAQPTDHSYAFDITSLVREWYSSSSAQNMGVIFKAADEVENATAHNHKTFGSYSSNYRPVFTLVYDMYTSITIHPVSITLNEGETAQISASSSLPDATVSWTSSNSAVATYNASTGRVTALKAGTATITATARTGDGLTYTASCAVTVYLPDGVYYIQNVNSDMYLHVEEGGVDNYTNVIQYMKYANSVIEAYKVRQMWKIYHLGNGIYSIRPMNKLNMGLDVSNYNVDIYNIGTTDTTSGVIQDAKWTIRWYSTGYVFRNNNSDSKVMQVENSSTEMLASVKAGTYSSSSLNCRWTLTQVSNPPTGVTLYDTQNKEVITDVPTKYINVGESKTLANLKLSASAYSGSSISQTLTWSSNKPSVLTVNSSTGEITGVSAGKATVTGTKYGEEVSFDVCVGYPDFFESMIDDGLFTADTLDNTDDGLFISLVPISTILNANGIYELPDKADNTSFTNVLAFYDDWYIFSVVNSTTTKYGLYKMREQESDEKDNADNTVADGDDPGVSISFIEFDISALKNIFNGAPTSSALYNLYSCLDEVIRPPVKGFSGDGFGFNLHDTDITEYFSDTNSDGAYLIAEKYITFIIENECNEDGIIDMPNAYTLILEDIDFYLNELTGVNLYDDYVVYCSNQLHRLRRIPNALNSINLEAERNIFDSTNKTLTILNKNNPTSCEKRAILVSFAGNATFNSFAAEVEFHADELDTLMSLLLDWYEAAIKADMSIAEGSNNDFFDKYYDLESDIVQAQANAHGEQ